MRLDTFITPLILAILLQLSACSSQSTINRVIATPSTTQPVKMQESEKALQIVHEMQELSARRHDLTKKAQSLPPDQFAERSDISLSIKAIDLSLKELQDAFFKRARRQFVSAAKAGDYQLYVNSCIRKIESVGNDHYPEEARGRLYGKAIVTFSVLSSGELEKVELSKSSGQPILDQASLDAIRQAAPFSEFPKEMAKQVDVLSITAPFNYDKSNGR